MKFLVIGYIWLYTHRPFEVWPVLADFQIERLYMIAMVSAWLLSPNRRLPPNFLHVAFFGFLSALLAAFLVSDYPDQGWKVVENVLKIFAFYVILCSSIRSSSDLKIVIVGFLAASALYQLHSLWEYRCGRHVYRMGTARMVGVDQYLGDPNSFAASVVYAIPFAICLLPVARKRLHQGLLIAYALLGASCIFLTGSRTGMAGLIVLLSLVILFSKKRLRYLLVIALLAVVGFPFLPEDRKERFMTLIDSSRGPANAQESADARSRYFTIALELWGQQPILGYGPGSFKIVSGSGQPAHTLYGEVLAEMGTLGALALLGVLAGFVHNHRKISAMYVGIPWRERDFLFWLSLAIQASILLHLFMGLGGHNTYRHTWLWFGAFQILATEFALHEPPPPDEQIQEDELLESA
jgi:O-antigen ligase